MKNFFEKILWWILEKRGITWGDKVEKHVYKEFELVDKLVQMDGDLI